VKDIRRAEVTKRNTSARLFALLTHKRFEIPELFVSLQPKRFNIRIMSHEERKAKMAENRAINSKKPARSAFMRWARAHKGAFVINDPELKAQLAYSE